MPVKEAYKIPLNSASYSAFARPYFSVLEKYSSIKPVKRGKNKVIKPVKGINCFLADWLGLENVLASAVKNNAIYPIYSSEYFFQWLHCMFLVTLVSEVYDSVIWLIQIFRTFLMRDAQLGCSSFIIAIFKQGN